MLRIKAREEKRSHFYENYTSSILILILKLNVFYL